MKEIFTSILTIVTILGSCSNAYSGMYTATGKIKSIKMTDQSLSIEGRAFLILDLVEAGTCHVDDSGVVPILIKNDDKGKEQYSMAFSSYMSDKTVKVQVDDSLHDVNNYCYLRSIGIDKSAD